MAGTEVRGFDAFDRANRERLERWFWRRTGDVDDAQDLAAITLVKLERRYGPVALVDAHGLTVWDRTLWVTARRTYADWVRARHARPPVAPLPEDGAAAGAAVAGPDSEARHRLLEVEARLGLLPLLQAHVLALQVEGCSRVEIGERLGLCDDQVKYQLRLARACLRGEGQTGAAEPQPAHPRMPGETAFEAVLRALRAAAGFDVSGAAAGSVPREPAVAVTSSRGGRGLPQ